jgi:MFS transporter, PPP family, 3-phenylpropionic acid transporter
MRPAGSLLRVRVLFGLLGVAESGLVPFLPLLLRERGLDPQALGMVLALMSGVAFGAGPLWGLLADRVLGYERTLWLSLAATVVAALVFAVTHRIAAVAVAGSLLWGVRAPIMAMADSMALVRLGPARRDAYGSVRLWMSAGFALGAIAFGGLVQSVGLGLVAPLYAGLCTINATAFALALRGRRLPRPAVTAAAPKPTAALTVLPQLSRFLLALLLANAAYNATYSFVAVRIAALGGGAVFVGLAAGLQAAAEVPSMAWTRRLARRLPPASVFSLGAVVYAVVYAAWAVLADPAALAALRLVSGVGFGLAYVGSVLVVDDLVPAHLRATGQAATKAVAFGLAPILGSLGGGLVYGYFGPAPFFLAAAAVTVAAAGVTYRTRSARLAGKEPKLEHA